jgi:hypothetical protein
MKCSPVKPAQARVQTGGPTPFHKLTAGSTRSPLACLGDGGGLCSGDTLPSRGWEGFAEDTTCMGRRDRPTGRMPGPDPAVGVVGSPGPPRVGPPLPSRPGGGENGVTGRGVGELGVQLQLPQHTPSLRHEGLRPPRAAGCHNTMHMCPEVHEDTTSEKADRSTSLHRPTTPTACSSGTHTHAPSPLPHATYCCVPRSRHSPVGPSAGRWAAGAGVTRGPRWAWGYPGAG